MAHRRKSSHPVCKTRRNLELSVQNVNDDDDVSIRVYIVYSCRVIDYRFYSLLIIS